MLLARSLLGPGSTPKFFRRERSRSQEELPALFRRPRQGHGPVLHLCEELGASSRRSLAALGPGARLWLALPVLLSLVPRDCPSSAAFSGEQAPAGTPGGCDVVLLRWVWGFGFGCSRWQKAEILVKGSTKAALGRVLCGCRKREALASLGRVPGSRSWPCSDGLGHSSPLLRLHGWNRGWHREGLQPSPPPPGTLLAAGPGAAAGAGPAARPGLPQGSCPHICIFPALPAVIGSPSARLVPARLRSPSASPSPACPARCLCLRCWAFLGRCPVPHKPCRDGAATRSLLGHGAGRTGEEGAARRGGRSRRRNSRVKPDPGFLWQRWLRPGD